MVQSVEILLDEAAEQVVRGQWVLLADAGLPSQARHTGTTNRPHITLAVARSLDQVQETAVAAAVSGCIPTPLRLGGLLVFGPDRSSSADWWCHRSSCSTCSAGC